MAEINIQITDTTSKKPARDPFLNKANVAKAANQIAQNTIAFPEIWTVETNNGDNSFSLVRGVKKRRNVHAVDAMAYKYIVAGDSVLVVYDNMDQRFPKIIRVVGKTIRDSVTPQTLNLTSWVQAEGNPYCSRGSVSQFAFPTFAGVIYTIETLPRLYYGSTFYNSYLFPNKISFEGIVIIDSAPQTLLPRVAAMVSVCDEFADNIVGYLLREYELQGTDWIMVHEWFRECATTLPATVDNEFCRKEGYLYYDKDRDEYTICSHEGLLLCTRGNEPNPSLCAWNNLTPGYGLPNQCISVVGDYALTGAYDGYEEGISGSRAECSVDVYSKASGSWVHVKNVVIANLFADCGIVLSCGNWSYADSVDAVSHLSSRWAYRSGEWIVFASAKSEVDGEVTKAKAKLFGINCVNGAVREIYSYTAPLELLNIYSTLITVLQEQMTYQSTPHPENWEPGVPYYTDTGHPLGWSSGDIGGYFVPDISEIPPTTGGPLDTDYRTAQQKIKTNASWTNLYDPTVAPETVSTNVGYGQVAVANYPRGLVDKANSDFYIILDECSWMSNEILGYGPDDGVYDYNHLYLDFDGGTIPGDPHPYRVFVLEKTGAIDCGRTFPGYIKRTKLMKFGQSSLTSQCEITRVFSETVGDKAYSYYRSPDVFEYCERGDYIWILADDWITKDEQRLSIILVRKSDMAEIGSFDIQPGGRDMINSGESRPQMFCGDDSNSVPWVFVGAMFDSSDSFVLQRLSYSTSGGFSSVTVFDTGYSGDYFEYMPEMRTIALCNGKQFWLEDGQTLKVREE